MNKSEPNLGDVIFADIDSNQYLLELYDSLLYNYGLFCFGSLEERPGHPARQLQPVNLNDILRFADLLSKSTHPTRREEHRVWAQEIAILCLVLYPHNNLVSTYATSVFTAVGNYQAMQRLDHKAYLGVLDQAFSRFQSAYLAIPGDEEKKFFAPQKKAFEAIDDEEAFSFSGPTSLGKSFIMRTFIKTQVQKGIQANFAILVPTKALINETRSKLINELTDELKEKNYRIVSAAGDIVLEGDHNFIFVMTPERMLYFLISKPTIDLDYLFIDEAHKLSGKNKRAPFYYQVVSILQNRERQPRFVFASPNIPNPEVFLRLVGEENNEREALATSYSPVTQFKFIVDLKERTVANYNDHTNQENHLGTIREGATLNDFLRGITHTSELGDKVQTLVYFGSKDRAVENARKYAKSLPNLHDEELDALAKDIERDIHPDYYLASLIRKGVTYHIGYLPPVIRERIEDLFRKKKISILFCTNTLLEGVNLPADNLVFTDIKIGRTNMTPIDFKNLIGRVGRLEYNLYGNAFFVIGHTKVKEKSYLDLLKAPVPEQHLSIETNTKIIGQQEKERIVAALKNGTAHLERGDETGDVYSMMRKFALILLRDITADRQSLVRREFADYIDEDTEALIKEKFRAKSTHQDDDINISVDQATSLDALIRTGIGYPLPDSQGRFNYSETLAFLEQLARVFKWDEYEQEDLGKVKNGRFVLLPWYATILTQWMEGHGLHYIMEEALRYRRKHRDTFWKPGKGYTHYSDDVTDRNYVLAETLEVIEKVILFKISNYFLRFSKEYKLFHNLESFPNDWYEFVEYGTTNQATITLQRYGFTRETATYIRHHFANTIVRLDDGRTCLNPALLKSENLNVRKEAIEIKYNVPEAFEMPEWLF